MTKIRRFRIVEHITNNIYTVNLPVFLQLSIEIDSGSNESKKGLKLHQCNRATLPGDFVIIIAQGVGRLPSTQIPKNLTISILRTAGIVRCTQDNIPFVTFVHVVMTYVKKIVLVKELTIFKYKFQEVECLNDPC